MKQITPNIYQISLGPVNTFLIEENKELTLIDTGFGGSADKIFAAIEKGGKSPKDIKRIILTHSHPDHSGSAAEIKRRLNIPVLAPAIDAELIEQGIAGRGKILSPGILNWIVYRMFIKNSPNEMEVVLVDQKLNDGDVLPILGGMKVIATPGHSLGHVVFLLPKEGVLIGGDLCANMMGLDYSTVYEDRAVGVKSIMKVAELEFDKMVFGHGNVLAGEANKKLKAHFGRLS
ncbi:MAG: fold metallo-hydrolase [Flavipsychrobacter sp.]|nr:fold metallo-hydrolase [Flavipsychrobacter sp.]